MLNFQHRLHLLVGLPTFVMVLYSI
jgi:hypothetical protein